MAQRVFYSLLLSYNTWCHVGGQLWSKQRSVLGLLNEWIVRLSRKLREKWLLNTSHRRLADHTSRRVCARLREGEEQNRSTVVVCCRNLSTDACASLVLISTSKTHTYALPIWTHIVSDWPTDYHSPRSWWNDTVAPKSTGAKNKNEALLRFVVEIFRPMCVLPLFSSPPPRRTHIRFHLDAHSLRLSQKRWKVAQRDT